MVSSGPASAKGGPPDEAFTGPGPCGGDLLNQPGRSLEKSPVRRRVKSYVLRSGRASAAQKRAYDELSGRYCLFFPALGEDFPGLDYAAVFGNSNPVTIEIGFGMGIATARIAQENPDRNYLGIEVHRPGIGRLLWEIDRRGLHNIRIIEADAVEVLERCIRDDSVAAFHIFFPDPWPKKKHRKRRLMTGPFTGLLAKKLAPPGYLYMVTDWEDYARQALAELSVVPELRNPYADPSGAGPGGSAGDFAGGYAPAQPWRPQTKFEAKGLAKNHGIWELYFIKRGGT
jgi:tRNA (guanine-N7-)-methyltransferase